MLPICLLILCTRCLCLSSASMFYRKTVMGGRLYRGVRSTRLHGPFPLIVVPDSAGGIPPALSGSTRGEMGVLRPSIVQSYGVRGALNRMFESGCGSIGNVHYSSQYFGMSERRKMTSSPNILFPKHEGRNAVLEITVECSGFSC